MGNPLEHIVETLLAIGIVIGLAIAGLIWLIVWLWSHLTWVWT